MEPMKVEDFIIIIYLVTPINHMIEPTTRKNVALFVKDIITKMTADSIVMNIMPETLEKMIYSIIVIVVNQACNKN
jgi:hypothetical protein